MNSRRHYPETAMVIRTYRELDEYVRAFIFHLSLFILIGRPGIQKSASLRRAVEERVCWLEGNVTPFRLFCELHEHRDQLVVIDDVDSLYADRSGVRLLNTTALLNKNRCF